MVAKYVAKTRTSKELTAKYRQWYADPRTVSGFNRRWKEMIYQIIVKEAAGDLIPFMSWTLTWPIAALDAHPVRAPSGPIPKLPAALTALREKAGAKPPYEAHPLATPEEWTAFQGNYGADLKAAREAGTGEARQRRSAGEQPRRGERGLSRAADLVAGSDAGELHA